MTRNPNRRLYDLVDQQVPLPPAPQPAPLPPAPGEPDGPPDDPYDDGGEADDREREDIVRHPPDCGTKDTPPCPAPEP